jgi:hypothetical protein
LTARLAAVVAATATLAAAQPARAQGATGSCSPQDLAALKGWEGVWGAEGLEGDIAGAVRAAPKFLGNDAPWNGAGWTRMRQLAALNRSNPLRIAAAWGFPTMMNSFSEVKFIIAPDETVITSQYRDIRYIYTDGRGHPPEDELWPNNWGDSIGCWKGDTLEIDTIGAKFDPVFSYMAAPLSEQAHFVERLRLVAPGRIEGEITITDPVTLTAPWTVKFAFVPAGIDRLIHEGDTLLDREEVKDGVAVFTAAEDDPLASAAVPAEVTLTPAQLDSMVGRYAIDGQTGQLVIERRSGRLFYRTDPGPAAARPLFADGPLNFSGVNGEAFRFLTDAAGKAVGLEFTGLGGQILSGKRVPA